MYRLSLLTLALFGFIQTYAQSPHGAKLKMDCAACHTSSGWLPVRDSLRFDHNTTAFPLDGLHKQADCRQCHTSLVFENAPSQCVNCHTDMHSMSVGNDCARCHSTKSWIVDNIPELHEQSGFPLVGSHIQASCVDCHKSETGLKFNPIGNDCVNCHKEDYQATTNPSHEKVGYSTNCIECHDPFALEWNADLINHDFFPLTMGHDNLDCKKCHVTGTYSDASPECVSCHLPDYNATTNPNHAHAKFPNNCAECHTTGAWSPSSFDHNTVYPLLGAHTPIANNCTQCHVNGYSNTPNTCVGCHLTDYNATTSPNHQAAQFPSDCKQCHTETAWIPSAFDHNNIYPLVGAHQAVANNCNLCHSAGYVNTPNTCVGCHLTDYNATTSPNHKTSQFPTDCKTCHTETSWIPSDFDHNTIYPLVGAHQPIANNCIQCHAAGYVNTPNTCVGCHLTDYNTTTSPNHQAAQFPKDCKQCHSETTWIPSAFDHNTIYPLVGAHQPIANNCNLCHAAGYVNTPNTCVGCHLPDYNATTNPNHKAAQFPTDCKQCHNEGAWTPADFDHDGLYFPIYSGKHKGEWSSCTDCHLNSSSYAVFSCINCHQHSDQTKVNNDHKDVNGYTYTSNACYSCHPDGRN